MYARSDRATDRESRERRTRRNILTGLQTGWPRGHLRHRRVCNDFFFSHSSSSCGPFSTITLFYIIFILYSPVITTYIIYIYIYYDGSGGDGVGRAFVVVVSTWNTNPCTIILYVYVYFRYTSARKVYTT